MKLFISLFISAMLMLSLTSCNEEPATSVNPSNTSLSKIILPQGAILQSATLNIYVNLWRGYQTDVHKVLVDWPENISWNTFYYVLPAPQYSSIVGGSFTPTTNDWYPVNITSIVADWVNGEPNYGVLLNQPVETPTVLRTRYDSRESTHKPYIEITYTLNGEVHTITEDAIADTYIREDFPDQLNGGSVYLYTGRTPAYTKQSLIKFDIEGTPQEECETAYAYGQGNSLSTLCFLDIPNKQGDNWGWTNKIGPSTTAYNWPIYAGAGLCDISKGTLVGTLNVLYTDGTVTITYIMDPLYTLGDTHVWVAEDPDLLPQKSNGKWISSPGQFNNNGMNPVVVNGLTGNIWIAAHSGVCWEVQ